MGEVTIINSKKKSSNLEHKNNLLLISSVALFLPYDVVVFILLHSTHTHTPTKPGPENCWDKFSLKKQHSQRSLFPPGGPKYTQHESQPNLEPTCLPGEGFCTCPAFTSLPSTAQLFFFYFPAQLLPLTMMNQKAWIRKVFFSVFLVPVDNLDEDRADPLRLRRGHSTSKDLIEDGAVATSFAIVSYRITGFADDARAVALGMGFASNCDCCRLSLVRFFGRNVAPFRWLLQVLQEDFMRWWWWSVGIER